VCSVFSMCVSSSVCFKSTWIRFATMIITFSEDNKLMPCWYMMKVAALFIFVLVLCMIKIMLSINANLKLN
jgi:hypothetical protein